MNTDHKNDPLYVDVQTNYRSRPDVSLRSTPERQVPKWLKPLPLALGIVALIILSQQISTQMKTEDNVNTNLVRIQSLQQSPVPNVVKIK